LEFITTIDEIFVVPEVRFNNKDYIEKRIINADYIDRGYLRTVLKYLYLTDGPINLPRERFKKAEKYLDQAEMILARWLITRTNGSLRAEYGKESLISARNAHYRCQICGFPDVRVLHIDHVNGRVFGSNFACLCANCHNIKSREKDWSGEKRYDDLEV